jgi:hypothetical protein
MSMSEQQVKDLIRTEVDKYMNDMKETLFLQLIGFLEHEVWKREHEGKKFGDEGAVETRTGAGGEGEQKEVEEAVESCQASIPPASAEVEPAVEFSARV